LNFSEDSLNTIMEGAVLWHPSYLQEGSLVLSNRLRTDPGLPLRAIISPPELEKIGPNFLVSGPERE